MAPEFSAIGFGMNHVTQKSINQFRHDYMPYVHGTLYFYTVKILHVYMYADNAMNSVVLIL